MSNRDVSPGDMEPVDPRHPQLSDEALESLLEAPSVGDGDGHPVADAIAGLRRDLTSPPAAAPSPALAEYLGVSPTTAMSPTTTRVEEIDIVDIRAARATTPWRPRVLASFTAAAGTAAGKIMFGTAIAAASVAGAHSTGVVDVPGLPDGGGEEVVVTMTAADTSSSSTSSSTTSSTSVPTTTQPRTDGGAVSAIPATSTTSSPSTTIDESAAVSGAFTFELPDVGSMTVQATDEAVRALEVAPAEGWSGEVRPSEPGEAEFRFTDGTATIDVEIEIDDGLWKVKVRNRTTDERTVTYIDGEGNVVARPDDVDDDDHLDEHDDDHDSDDDGEDSDHDDESDDDNESDDHDSDDDDNESDDHDESDDDNESDDHDESDDDNESDDHDESDDDDGDDSDD